MSTLIGLLFTLGVLAVAGAPAWALATLTATITTICVAGALLGSRASRGRRR